MKALASRQEFEKAGKIKRQLFALQHIQDVALIKHSTNYPLHAAHFRIEAYDIAHISGTSTVGVMTVLENGEVEKSQYRKFKVRSVTKGSDTAALAEVFTRRLKHSEWPLPQLVVADGGIAQVNILKRILKKRNISIPVVGIVKDEQHKPKDIYGSREVISKHKKDILLVNNEAHRFALSYHRELRSRMKKN